MVIRCNIIQVKKTLYDLYLNQSSYPTQLRAVPRRRESAAANDAAKRRRSKRVMDVIEDYI